MSQIKLLSMINFGKLECLCGVREPSVIYVNAYLNSNRSSQLTAQHLMISTNVNDNVCLVIYSVLVSLCRNRPTSVFSECCCVGFLICTGQKLSVDDIFMPAMEVFEELLVESSEFHSRGGEPSSSVGQFIRSEVQLCHRSQFNI